MAALSFLYVIGACLILPFAAAAQVSSYQQDLSDIADWGQDITSETVRVCLRAVPGDLNIRDEMSELGWREVHRSDRQETHILALATFQFSDSLHQLSRTSHPTLNVLYVKGRTYEDDPDNIYNSAWDQAIQDARQQALRTIVRNSPRQTIWFDMPASMAFLQVKTDSDNLRPHTYCDIAVTTDIGASSIVTVFQETSSSDLPPVFGTPLQWSQNGETSKLLYRTLYETPALEGLIADGFDFIGHVQVKHSINRQVQQ